MEKGKWGGAIWRARREGGNGLGWPTSGGGGRGRGWWPMGCLVLDCMKTDLATEDKNDWSIERPLLAPANGRHRCTDACTLWVGWTDHKTPWHVFETISELFLSAEPIEMAAGHLILGGNNKGKQESAQRSWLIPPLPTPGVCPKEARGSALDVATGCGGVLGRQVSLELACIFSWSFGDSRLLN